MADITLKLVWYRLSLGYSKMAAAANSWYTDVDFDSYVLDLLLVAWCAGAAILMVTINKIKEAVGKPVKQPVDRLLPSSASGVGADGSSGGPSVDGETCQWFNSVVGWLYLHYYHHPTYLDEWVRSLNEQLTKLGVSSPI